MKTGQLINSAIVFFSALLIGFYSFVSFPSQEKANAEEWDIQESIVSKNSRDVLIFMPESDFTMNVDQEKSHIDVNLKKGGLLFATKANDFTISVNMDYLRVNSQESIAFVEVFEDSKTKIYGLKHPSLLEFVQNEESLNSIFIPSGNYIEVSSSKVNSALSKLRLSKLVKEFRAVEFSKTELPTYVADALVQAEENYTKYAINYSALVYEDLKLGPLSYGFSAQLYDFYKALKASMTFVPSAKIELANEEKSNLLTYSLSNFLYGESSNANAWLNKWIAESHYPQEIQNLYSDLFFVLPGEKLYPLKLEVIKMNFNGETSEYLRRQFLEVESLLEKSSVVEAQGAMNLYKEALKNFLNSDNSEENLASLSREYFLIENLVKENYPLYKADYADLLIDMELKILDLSASEVDSNEERQAFVLSKIQFLNSIFETLMEKRISTEDASELAKTLLLSANEHMTFIPSNVGIKSWYESELAKAELSIGFINSPEFALYTDFEEGLKSYSEKVTDLANLQAYLQEIRTGAESDLPASLTLEEAEAQVRQAFQKEAISYTSLESQGDFANRLFKINGAKFDEYEFSANYDRESELLYDLLLSNGLRFSTGISLSNLREVVKNVSVQDLTENIEDDLGLDSNSQTSMTDSFLLQQIALLFESYGLSEKDFIFEVLDSEKSTFSFEGKITKESIYVKGELDLASESVSNLSWSYNGIDYKMPNMPLKQVESAISAMQKALKN